MLIKQHYWYSNGRNILQLVFAFIIFFNNYLILLFCFSRGITNMVQVTVPAVVGNNLQTSLPVHLLAYTSAVAH